MLPVFSGRAETTETLAEKTLKEIVARERDIFARAGAEGEHVDEARLRGELQGVINSYDVLIQKSPDFAPAYVTYGMLLGKVGMTKEAVAILLKANKLDPEIPLVKNEIAKYLAEDGKPVDALPWITAVIDLAPQEPLYHYHLGKLIAEGRDDFLLTGKFTRPELDQTMLGAFQHAAELSPKDFALAYRHAKAYYDLQTPRWPEALAAWEKIEALPQTDMQRQLVGMQKANVLLKLGRPAEARPLLDSVTDPALTAEKQTLLDQLAKAGEK